MATYKTFESLNGKTLKHGDRVIFSPKQKYFVMIRRLGGEIGYLEGMGDLENNDIFKRIGLQSEVSRYKFAARVYGSRVIRGVFPQPESDVAESLTNMALVLFAAVAKDPYIEIKVKGKWEKINLGKFEYIEPVIVKLTNEYDAELLKDGVEVGCQFIKYDTIKTVLTEASKKGYIIDTPVFHIKK